MIQTEAVSDRRKPITLKAAVYDGATPVTSVDIVVFDSSSDSMEDRKKTIRLDLLSGEFDKKKAYRLVQGHAMTSWDEGRDFYELLSQDEQVSKLAPGDDLRGCFDPEYYLRHIDTTFKRLGI